MTEKHYGGSSSFGAKDNSTSNSNLLKENSIKKQSKEKTTSDKKTDSLQIEGFEDYVQAGKIAVETIKYARSFIVKGTPLLEISEKIESKILELGGKPAFPVNLSINETAAHATPSYNDTSLAFGLLKVDLGVHINGFTADTAFSLDLENSEENKQLIKAAELALAAGVEKISHSVELKEIGKAISQEMSKHHAQPIINLSGHSIEQYNLHAGITIPNTDNSSNFKIPSGVYAIEPFSTTLSGSGSIRDGRPSGIYHLQSAKPVRDNFAREVLNFIAEEYETLPFCSRWIYKKFGARGLLALRQIEASGALYHYAQLIETTGSIVAQAEHTIIISENKKVVITQ